MTFLQKIFGTDTDPTSAWPAVDTRTPDINLDQMRFGPLRFGASMESARVFGRPDRFTWHFRGYCDLLYARAGFQIDFKKNRLDYLAFFIGPDPYQPDHPDLIFSEPQIVGGLKLTHEIEPYDLTDAFGTETASDTDEEETLLTFSRSGAVLEFEFNPAGHLKRFSLFPENRNQGPLFRKNQG